MIATTLLLASLVQVHADDLSRVSTSDLVRQIPRQGEAQWLGTPKAGGMHLAPPLAELRRRIEAGKSLQLADWQTILVDKGYLRSRPRWPAAEPFAVSFHLPALYQGLSVELVPRKPAWKWAKAAHWEMMCGLGLDAKWDSEDYQQLGSLPVGKHTLLFDVVVRTPLWGKPTPDDVEERVTRPGQVALDVEVVERFEDALQATDDYDVTSAIRSGLALRKDFIRDSEPSSTLVVVAERWPADVTASLECTLRHDGKIIETVKITSENRGPHGTIVRLKGLPVHLVRDRKKSEEWTLDVRGVPPRTLNWWGAARYWSGKFQISVSELPRR